MTAEWKINFELSLRPREQSESSTNESGGSLSTYTADSEIEEKIKQDPQAITVPITVCVSIMIG